MKIDEQVARVHAKPDDDVKRNLEHRAGESNMNDTMSRPNRSNGNGERLDWQRTSKEYLNGDGRITYSNQTTSSSSNHMGKGRGSGRSSFPIQSEPYNHHYHHSDHQSSSKTMNTMSTTTTIQNHAPGSSSSEISPTFSNAIRLPSDGQVRYYQSPLPSPSASTSFRAINSREDIRDCFGRLAEFATDVYHSGRVPTRYEVDSAIRSLSNLMENVQTNPGEVRDDEPSRFRYQKEAIEDIDRSRRSFKPFSPPVEKRKYEDLTSQREHTLRPSTSMSALPTDHPNASRMDTSSHLANHQHVRTNSSDDYRSESFKSESAESRQVHHWPTHPAYGDRVIESRNDIPSPNLSRKNSRFHEADELIRQPSHYTGMTAPARGNAPQLPTIGADSSHYHRRSPQYGEGIGYNGERLGFREHSSSHPHDRSTIGVPSLPPPPSSSSTSSSTSLMYQPPPPIDRRGSMDKIGQHYPPRRHSPSEVGSSGTGGYSRQFNHYPTHPSEGRMRLDEQSLKSREGINVTTVGFSGENSSSYISGDESLNGSFTGLRPSKYRKRSRAPAPGSCVSCHAKDTPEWRRGPKGARTLCNACGLHYSKLVRKKRKDESDDLASVSIEELRASLKLPEN